jgi:hypothetical protein
MKASLLILIAFAALLCAPDSQAQTDDAASDEAAASAPSPPPEAVPSQPPATLPAPPAPTEQAPPPTGQWTYTSQYGWVWIPYDQAYTSVSPGAGVAYEYVYYPTFGWRWVSSPWVFGFGPSPYWGPRGRLGFAWYAHPWFDSRGAHRGGNPHATAHASGGYRGGGSPARASHGGGHGRR